jgi:hypothetical protein
MRGAQCGMCGAGLLYRGSGYFGGLRGDTRQRGDEAIPIHIYNSLNQRILI